MIGNTQGLEAVEVVVENWNRLRHYFVMTEREMSVRTA
jgi:hypothetical protein